LGLAVLSRENFLQLKKNITKQLTKLGNDSLRFYNPNALTYTLNKPFLPGIPGLPDVSAIPRGKFADLRRIATSPIILGIIWHLLNQVRLQKSKLVDLQTEEVLFNALRLLEITLVEAGLEVIPDDGSNPQALPISEKITFLDSLFFEIEGESIASSLFKFYIDQYDLKVGSKAFCLSCFFSSPLLALLISRILHRLRYLLSETKDNNKLEKILFKSVEKSTSVGQTVVGGDRCAYCQLDVGQSDAGYIAFISYTPILQAVNTSASLHYQNQNKALIPKGSWWKKQIDFEKSRRDSESAQVQKKQEEVEVDYDKLIGDILADDEKDYVEDDDDSMDDDDFDEDLDIGEEDEEKETVIEERKRSIFNNGEENVRYVVFIN
jgi:hypothetical protein